MLPESNIGQRKVRLGKVRKGRTNEKKLMTVGTEAK